MPKVPYAGVMALLTAFSYGGVRADDLALGRTVERLLREGASHNDISFDAVRVVDAGRVDPEDGRRIRLSFLDRVLGIPVGANVAVFARARSAGRATLRVDLTGDRGKASEQVVWTRRQLAATVPAGVGGLMVFDRPLTPPGDLREVAFAWDDPRAGVPDLGVRFDTPDGRGRVFFSATSGNVQTLRLRETRGRVLKVLQSAGVAPMDAKVAIADATEHLAQLSDHALFRRALAVSHDVVGRCRTPQEAAEEVLVSAFKPAHPAGARAQTLPLAGGGTLYVMPFPADGKTYAAAARFDAFDADGRAAWNGLYFVTDSHGAVADAVASQGVIRLVQHMLDPAALKPGQ